MKKALVLYASITGNTEKIGFAFRDALQEMGWEVDTFKMDRKTNFVENPIFFDDYDLLFLGSPIMAGVPSPLLPKHLGLTQSIPPRMYSDRLIMPGLKRPETDDYAPYGVVYATYGGASTGPKECLATLEIEKLYLDNLYMDHLFFQETFKEYILRNDNAGTSLDRFSQKWAVIYYSDMYPAAPADMFQRCMDATRAAEERDWQLSFYIGSPCLPRPGTGSLPSCCSWRGRISPFPGTTLPPMPAGALGGVPDFAVTRTAQPPITGMPSGFLRKRFIKRRYWTTDDYFDYEDAEAVFYDRWASQNSITQLASGHVCGRGLLHARHSVFSFWWGFFADFCPAPVKVDINGTGKMLDCEHKGSEKSKLQ